ncbi:TPA: DUF4102 domain-containing protein [Salmonella enterica]|nr:DUF4102 domain-containing protein [Salmonella enterica]HEA0351468.1 DUF4102 domain-containing protein [Salmonella enterica]HEA0384377.1 DUF4102 domain-containing protein [Salmonella enterica]
MALTDTAIRKPRPTDTPFKLGGSAGLYLLIKPNGSKLWYMKYRIPAARRGRAAASPPCYRRKNANAGRWHPPAPQRHSPSQGRAAARSAVAWCGNDSESGCRPPARKSLRCADAPCRCA